MTAGGPGRRRYDEGLESTVAVCVALALLVVLLVASFLIGQQRRQDSLEDEGLPRCTPYCGPAESTPRSVP